MNSITRRVLGTSLMLAVVAPLAVLAESYTVTLRNGGVFHTRYQPRLASWDANKVLVITEVGNLISLSKGDIDKVASDTENRGFGKVINNTTVMLGYLPNEGPGNGGDAGGDQQQKPYSVDQFVEPSATQGLPGSWIGGSSSTPRATPPPAPAPSPAPTPAPASPPAQ